MSEDSCSDKTESSSIEDFSDSEEFNLQNSDNEREVPVENIECDLGEPTYDARQIHKMFQAKKLEKFHQAMERHVSPEDKPLSLNGEKIIEIIKNNSQDLKRNELRILFQDPFFKNQVCLVNTKSGLKVIIHKKDTNEHISFSTHKKHTKNYKGFHRAFISDLQKAIAMFGL